MIDRHIGFVHALRETGLPVSLAEGLDAARALRHIDLADREILRQAYAVTLVKRPQHREGFDVLFDLWFPSTTQGPPKHRAEDPEDLRTELAELLGGDPAAPEFRAFAQAMVERFGRVQAGPGRQSWFSYPVMRALSPQTLIARLLGERGGLAEKLARQRVTANIAAFEAEVASDVRRRIAEEQGRERITRSAVRPPIDRRDFLRVTKAELAEMRREIHPLARRLATRLSMKHKKGDRGRLDFRRTVRASLQSGGVPLTTHLKPRRPHKPELVVVTDASDSVAGFAQFTLLLTFALREQFTKVRAFAFVDTVDEITRYFAPGTDVLDAITRMTSEADISRFGRTDYGHVLKTFEERHTSVLTPKTSLLILGDARSNHQPPNTETLKRLAGKVRHAYWLNPEPRDQWDTGDSVASGYAAIIPMYECRNVRQLAAFIEETVG
ncbi:VWA domain-containing protein [Herbidospora galbida]|uniref:VWA domain-containing protein n=1 Tax=Herbidospora galbida TaxID=2575442 RepID=A0A4U3MH31_9ACTN|nr:VWA domain-containing protein [Herbidospora galbida]TKK88758.1 VWA domain-containing protein [Herbidospora galbida]